ncbi:RNA polymerase sigma-70 factor [uncultured Draconibacterium sp.]|uniref:RNA polymerase sigma factor n=1 Tax=uncultured Draconibacterium sp. TaxID=1573823 RepID=UPI0029C02014|nr:RNA polymerase sigma-70 factor [uncultured Draconibacterium sp.]
MIRLESDKDIKELLKSIALKGDERAFKLLFDKYSTSLYQFSFSFLKNKSLTEEVVSDVFFRVWLNRSELINILNLKSYLFKATYNTSISYLTQQNKKSAISLEEVEVELGVDLICPETELINKELKELISEAIENLPPRCKIIYKMAKVEQMKYKEIAELLDISVKTINHQLSIALKRIGEVIKKYLQDQGDNGEFMILFQLFLPKR